MLGKVARNRGTWGNINFLLGEMEKRWGEACDDFVLNLVSIQFFPPRSQLLILKKEMRMGSFSQKYINKTMLIIWGVHRGNQVYQRDKHKIINTAKQTQEKVVPVTIFGWDNP